MQDLDLSERASPWKLQVNVERKFSRMIMMYLFERLSDFYEL